MMISKTGTIKTLRMLGFFCAIAMGFMCLVGTSSDDVEDAVGVPDFDEPATIELESVTTSFSSGASIMANGDCDDMSVRDAIAAIEDEIGESLDSLDDLRIRVTGVRGTYTADWEPDTEGPITCRLSITGTQSAEIAVTVIDEVQGSIDGTLDQGDLDAINYYLNEDNWDETFTYCVSCTDTSGITSYTVTYDVIIDIQVKGDIDVL